MYPFAEVHERKRMARAVKIYTASYCGYCRMAKTLLASRKIAFEEIDVTSDFEAREWLVRETGRRTVPQIFIDGESIGGFDELRVLDARGRLAGRVNDEAT
jgi:glutaredoxin 3